MNSMSQTFNPHSVFGIYEIDMSGTVCYHRTPAAVMTDKQVSLPSAASLIGHNFFDAIAPFSNEGELQYHVRRFIKDSHSTDEFRINFHCQEQILEGRVKLARLRERENNSDRSLIIIDIRKA